MEATGKYGHQCISAWNLPVKYVVRVMWHGNLSAVTFLLRSVGHVVVLLRAGMMVKG